jgi:hypothetical protein
MIILVLTQDLIEVTAFYTLYSILLTDSTSD